MSYKQKIIIGITMGDPAGAGPEIIVRALTEIRAKAGGQGIYLPLIIGSRDIIEHCAQNFSGPDFLDQLCSISSTSEIQDEHLIYLLDLKNIRMDQFKIGQAQPQCGRASVEYIEQGIELCQRGAIQAMVTAPISKEAMNLAGFHFAGHTELLACRTKTTNYAMMLAGGPLRVVLVTTHAAIAKVSSLITQEGIYKTIKLTHQWLGKFYPGHTSLAVCGLNPHAGENGLFGREEIDIILPAIEQARAENIPVKGPYPADTLFYQAQKGKFAAVIVMYHDQGLIPLKMLAFDTGVNITLGLPIIRTSVDHGTAYDIAWQGKAKTGSMLAALECAAYLAERNQGRKG